MHRRTLLTAAALALPAAAAEPATPSDLANRFAATLTAHDITAFAALFADDYVNHQLSAATPPPPPNKTPKELTIAFFAARLTGIPDLKVTIEALVIAQDQFAASLINTGTQTGPLYGVPPTGKTLRFTSCDIFRVQNGLIAEHWGMGDIAGVLAQLKS